MIRRRRCECCELVERIEYWWRAPGRNTRWESLHSKLVYHTGENGERYLAPPGQGPDHALPGRGRRGEQRPAQRDAGQGEDRHQEPAGTRAGVLVDGPLRKRDPGLPDVPAHELAQHGRPVIVPRGPHRLIERVPQLLIDPDSADGGPPRARLVTHVFRC